MSKQVFGQYAAFITKGGVRFQQNNKMVSEKAVPTEVVDFLYAKLGVERQPEQPVEQVPEQPKFPMPSPEELARMREESLRVPPELQLTPEEQATRALTGVPDNEVPLNPDDFDAPDSAGEQPLPRAVESVPLPQERVMAQPAVELPTPAEIPLPSEPVSNGVDPSFMESVSIYTASLTDMARALYDRFGIYSVYLNQLPQGDEINPLTGGQFTKYHLGIAYQSAISAHTNGIINPEGQRQVIDDGRAASEHFHEAFEPAPVTMADARKQNSFDYRTAVAGTREVPTTVIEHVRGADGQIHAVQREIPVSEQGGVAPSRYDNDENEQVLEPPIFGGKPIIRPNW